VTDHLDPWDRALLEALERPEEDLSTLAEIAESSGLSPALLEALARERFLVPTIAEPEPLYPREVVEVLEAGLALMGAGLPLGELLDLARAMDEAMRPVADRAVEVFATFVRDSVEANAGSTEDAVDRLVEAFKTMLPATGRLVDHHFRELLIARARQRLTE